MNQHTVKPITIEKSFDIIAVFEDELPDASTMHMHRHEFGQFTIIRRGVMEINVGDKNFLTLPHYALWIPAGIYHSCNQRESAIYNVIYVNNTRSRLLPEKPVILKMDRVIEALLHDFTERGIEYPDTCEDKRQAQVMLDHFQKIPPETTYLPMARSQQLRKILSALSSDPGNDQSLKKWAKVVHSTERTLARKCEKELGMSFTQWRQRLRLTKAIDLLCEGNSVEQTALFSGYATSSSFIAMFKRHTGVTPALFCNNL